MPSPVIPMIPEMQRLIGLLRADGFTLPNATPRIGWFGDGPELAQELGNLVRQGVKAATAGLVWAWEAEGEFPRVGDIEIIIDWRGEPLAVIELTEVRVLPFEQVDAAFAHDEGEGDRSLAAWRKGHWRYFSRECARLGREPTPTMPVVCQRFRLLHVVVKAPSGGGR